ncbi:MAG: WD40 repeat domain-containing protein [Xenococcus sp. (in: cyanobacteria)]
MTSDFSQLLSRVSKQDLVLAFSPDGKMFASGGLDGKVYLWRDLTNLDHPQKIGHHNKSIASLAFNWNGTTLASGIDDKTIKHWTLENQSQTESMATL